MDEEPPWESVISLGYEEGFCLLVQGTQLVIKRSCECIIALSLSQSVAFLPIPRLFMRILLKMAFSLLIWPISAMAQGPPPSGQPYPSGQGPTEAQGPAAASDTTTAANPTSIRIPVPVQTRAFLSLQPLKQAPPAAGYAPELKLSAGYSVTNLGMPSSVRVVLGGMNVSISADSSKRFGAKLDLGYARAPNVFGSRRNMDMLSYLVGPVFYPSNGNLLSTYAHFLAGGARVAGPFLDGNGGLQAGHVQYPAWAFGGGAEYRLSPAFGFRVSVDYLHTHFYNPSQAVRGQNALRVVNSIVFYPGMPSIGRHRKPDLRLGHRKQSTGAC